MASVQATNNAEKLVASHERAFSLHLLFSFSAHVMPTFSVPRYCAPANTTVVALPATLTQLYSLLSLFLEEPHDNLKNDEVHRMSHVVWVQKDEESVGMVPRSPTPASTHLRRAGFMANGVKSAKSGLPLTMVQLSFPFNFLCCWCLRTLLFL
jgi:hypothetical protein